MRNVRAYGQLVEGKSQWRNFRRSTERRRYQSEAETSGRAALGAYFDLKNPVTAGSD
jgi:hypothetical protein